MSDFKEELRVGWKGTLLAIQLKLDQPLDLKDVYRTLPPPSGYEETPIDLF